MVTATKLEFILSLHKLLFMKHKLLLAFTILFGLAGFSQSYEGSVTYNKKKQDAFIIEYAYSPEAVENAILQKMEQLGYKSKEQKGIFNKDKGFHVYKGAYITEVSDKSMDYIIKVERKSRREKEESIVYMIMQKDGGNARSAFEAMDVDRAKSFLNDLAPNVEASHLEIQIREQDEVVVKADRKFKKLQDDKKDMEDKIRKLEEDIKNNTQEQEAAQRDIEVQRAALENLKLKRKTKESF
jgi:hypothetical protein